MATETPAPQAPVAEPEKKGFKFPTAFTVLFFVLIIVFARVCTCIIIQTVAITVTFVYVKFLPYVANIFSVFFSEPSAFIIVSTWLILIR